MGGCFRCPFAFGVAVALFVLPSWVVIRSHYKGQLDVLRERVSLRDDRIALLAGRVTQQRSLTGQQRRELSERLRGKLEGHLQIGYAASDTESYRYAKNISDLMQEIGLYTALLHGHHDEGESGLVLYVANTEMMPPDPSLMKEALTAAGVPFTVMRDFNGSPGGWYLHVSPVEA